MTIDQARRQKTIGTLTKKREKDNRIFAYIFLDDQLTSITEKAGKFDIKTDVNGLHLGSDELNIKALKCLLKTLKKSLESSKTMLGTVTSSRADIEDCYKELVKQVDTSLSLIKSLEKVSLLSTADIILDFMIPLCMAGFVISLVSIAVVPFAVPIAIGLLGLFSFTLHHMIDKPAKRESENIKKILNQKPQDNQTLECLNGQDGPSYTNRIGFFEGHHIPKDHKNECAIGTSIFVAI